MNSFSASNIFTATNRSLGSSFINQSLASCINVSIGQALFSNAAIVNYAQLTNVFFGAGFSQTLNTFSIRKDQLPGLTVLINNRAESLFVGLLAKWLEIGEDNESKVNVTYWGTGIDGASRISTIEIKLFNLISNSTNELGDISEIISPMDY